MIHSEGQTEGDRATMRIEVVPVTPQRWDELVALFATSRVTSECWCMWPRLERGEFRPGDPSYRHSMWSLVRSGMPPGLIGLVAGRPVGWVAVGPRHNYPQYGERLAGPDVWVIACLFVEESARRMGVARALVEAAVGYAGSHGASVVDGPPPWWLPGEAAAIPAAKEAFLANGFEEIGPGARMPILRRKLD